MKALVFIVMEIFFTYVALSLGQIRDFTGGVGAELLWIAQFNLFIGCFFMVWKRLEESGWLKEYVINAKNTDG